MNTTKDQILSSFNITLELGRTIKNHGKIGKYYLLELCCGLLDYARFSKALDVLKDQDLITEDNGQLIWKG